jgi:hypothetical protein
MRWQDIALACPLVQIGLPISGRQCGLGTVLAGRMAECSTDAELREMLAGGVLMDSTALLVLEERKLDGPTGVRVGARHTSGAIERFSDDPLNGPAAGQCRDARIEQWGDALGQADVLEPVRDGVRSLAVLENYRHDKLGPCMTAYQNEMGGRVVVTGYSPWANLLTDSKRTQLLNVADWVSSKKMPIRVVETLPLAPFVRLSEDRRRGLVVVLNYGLELIEQATLLLRMEHRQVWLNGPAGLAELPCHEQGEAVSVRLPRMEAWSTVCLLLAEKAL